VVSRWSINDVADWAASRNFSVPTIQKLRDQEVSGNSLLTLKYDELTKPPFNIPGGPANEIVKFAEQLQPVGELRESGSHQSTIQEHPRPTVININWTDERGEEKKKEAYQPVLQSFHLWQGLWHAMHHGETEPYSRLLSSQQQQPPLDSMHLDTLHEHTTNGISSLRRRAHK